MGRPSRTNGADVLVAIREPTIHCGSKRRDTQIRAASVPRAMPKTALVTGSTGQDGSYLMELLLGKGYNVYGLVRRLSSPNVANIAPLVDQVHLLDGDMTDQSSINTALKEAKPDEIYNLAAQSFVQTSFRQPDLTADVNGLGVIRL